MKIFNILFALVLFTSLVYSQQGYQDVVYLINGDIAKGIIIENVPNDYIKMQNENGLISTFKYADIAKFVREKIPQGSEKFNAINKDNMTQEQNSDRVNVAKLKINIAGMNVEYEGNEQYLETRLITLLESVNKSQNNEIKRNLLGLNESQQQNLELLNSYSENISQAAEEFSTKMKEFTNALMSFMENIKSNEDNQTNLLDAISKMQEMSMSFNLQYLMLQNKISRENREFSMISIIMKNKHDTAKNSINNIR